MTARRRPNTAAKVPTYQLPLFERETAAQGPGADGFVPIVAFQPARLAVRFTVPGEPKSKQRARMASAPPRGGKPVVYTPKATVDAELNVRARYLEHAPARYRHHDGLVVLACRFRLSKGTVRDGDNMLKLVQDALNGAAYADDSQVVQALVQKVASPGHPGTDIEVWHL